MSRAKIGDRDFGKGRHDDSSSSRDSSPRLAKKRSFSPASDDEDLVIPPIADDDTPPPPERPLIRQAVAFAWPDLTGTTVATPPALNTYEMMPTTNGMPRDSLFLPGQEVLQPLQSQKKKNDASRKKKKTDYGGQANRFRLDTTVPPSEPTGTLYSPSSASTLTLQAVSRTSSMSATSPITPLLPPALRLPSMEVASSTSNHHVSTLQPTTSVSRWKIADPQVAAGPSRLPPAQYSVNSRPDVNEARPRDPSTSYYRRDYDKDRESDAFYPQTTYTSRQRTASHTTVTVKNHDRSKVDKRLQKAPILMLTLLIQDIRSGVVDHQLAEVKVPMRTANDPKDGFWADAKVLGQQLQSSASRIDGKSFVQRQRADNNDEFISTHLAIKADRMLDVVVEELIPPGQVPQPPKIPRSLLASSSSDSTSDSTSHESDFNPPTHDRAYERMMKEVEEYRQRQANLQRSPSPEPTPRGRRSRKGKTQKQEPSPVRARSSSAESIPAAFIPQGIRFESPVNGDPPEEVQKLIIETVDQLVQEDEEWTDFFRAKAAREPHRAMDVLEQYRFVNRMLDTFAGKKVPFRSFKAKIKPIHITQALRIEDPNFASACVETLSLLELYGEDGQRCQDPRVIELVKDTSAPEYNAKPIKRLLHLMRDIDKRWKEDHPADTSSAEGRNATIIR
ncbi:hypothetical protein H0H92_014469 [Tricholoma furcatifolium]|nr:hypothetical protein H0H92_014469 [Tricholoma furcatifolium]